MVRGPRPSSTITPRASCSAGWPTRRWARTYPNSSRPSPTPGTCRCVCSLEVPPWWWPAVDVSSPCAFNHGGPTAGCVTGGFVGTNYDLRMAYQSLLLQEQILAIDIGATNIKFAHVNDLGELVRGVRRRPTPYPCTPSRVWSRIIIGKTPRV